MPHRRRRKTPGTEHRTEIFTRRDGQFLAFFVVSYAAWLTMFSIQRYAVVLELLCAPLIVLLIARCMAATPGAPSGRTSAVPASSVMIAIALCVALWTQPGDWFRRPWSNPYNPSISKSLE